MGRAGRWTLGAALSVVACARGVPAAAPPAALSLGVVPVSLVDAFFGERGRAMACGPELGDRIALCVREQRAIVVDGTPAIERRWLAADDLAGIVAPVVARLGAEPAVGRRVDVADFGRAFWQTTAAPGEVWAAPLVDPAPVRRALGATGPLLVAAPRDGLLMAWVPGDPAFDRVMAIAVREAYDAGPGSISPALLWNEEGTWRYHGEAVPR